MGLSPGDCLALTRCYHRQRCLRRPCAHQAVLGFATFVASGLLLTSYVSRMIVDLLSTPGACSMTTTFSCVWFSLEDPPQCPCLHASGRVMLSSTCCLWPTLFCSLNQQDFVDLSPGDSRCSGLCTDACGLAQ